MTEPDEALIWAKESAYQKALEAVDGDAVEASNQLDHEDAAYVIEWLADTYRAGQAASAERIKALEHIAGAAQQRANDHGEQLLDAYERIKALEEVTQNLIALLECDDPEVSARAWDEALDEARALLKEADHD